MRLKWHLLLLVVIILVPGIALPAVLTLRNFEDQRHIAADGMRDTVSAFTFALDQELRLTVGSLESISTIVSLDPETTGHLRRSADSLRRQHPNWGAMVIVDVASNRIFELWSDTDHVAVSPEHLSTSRQAVETAKPAISGIFESRLLGSRAVAIHVPVMGQARMPRHSLGVLIPAQHLTQFLQQRGIPEGWVAGIIDRSGIVVARSRGAEQFVGRPAPPWVVNGIRGAENGQLTGPALEGESLFLVFERSQVSGWTVAFAAPMSVYERPLNRALWTTAGAGLAVILVASALALYYSSRITRAVSRLGQAAQALGRNDPLPAFAGSKIAEIDSLQRAFATASADLERSSAARERLAAEASAAHARAEVAEQHTAEITRAAAERVKLETQLRQAQRMEAIGQLTGGMAHDFNNILGIVVGNLDLALERVKGDPETRTLVESALNGALSGSELVQRLLAFARRQPLAPKPIDVNAWLPELSALLRRTLGENITVNTVPRPGLWHAIADRTQLESAVLNLAINARDAMPKGGTLTLETANVHFDEAYVAANPDAAVGEYVMLAVSDTGTGMPPEVVARAFEPFYTTKPVGKGSGLGLSMIHGFAKQSKGHVKIYSEVGHGTTVKLYLPRAEAAADTGRVAPAADDALPRGSEAILAVEDNPGMRLMAEMALKSLGYRVRMAESGPSALRALEAGEPADLLFTDIVMPEGMSGVELAAEAAKRRPGLRVLFTTGFAEASLAGGRLLPAGASVLNKPYRKGELARAIRRALDGAGGK